MSKHPDATTVLKLSNLFWFVEDNVSRPTGFYKDPADKRNLASLLVPGWDGQLGRPLTVKLDDAGQAEAVKRLEAFWAELKALPISTEPEAVAAGEGTVKVAPAELLSTFEKLYTKSDKVIAPTHRAITCFRRAGILLLANTVRAKQGEDFIIDLPCTVREYENPLDMLTDNIRENGFKTKGSRGMSAADNVGSARKMFQLNAREADLMRAMGISRGMAQKLHRLCVLDAEHPGLGIVNAILEGTLSEKPLDKEKIKELLDKKASDEDVAAFLETPGAGNAPKIMSKKDIETMASQNPIELVKLVCQAILKNDVTILTSVVLQAGNVNAAVTAAMNGQFIAPPVAVTK